MSEGLIFSFENNEYSVTGYEVNDENVVIPGTFNGYPVTSISKNALKYCFGLTSVTVPNGVTIIGDVAFLWCDNLKNWTIPDSVKSIGEQAFRHYKRLKSVTFGDLNGWMGLKDDNFENTVSKVVLIYPIPPLLQST